MVHFDFYFQSQKTVLRRDHIETRMVVSRLVGDYVGDESITILAREERGLKVFHLRTSNARPDENLALKVDRYLK